MSNQTILSLVNQTGAVTTDSTIISLSKGEASIHIWLDTPGVGAKVGLYASADGTSFILLNDPNTISGVAEYDASTITHINKIGDNWSFKAVFSQTSGTTTAVKTIISEFPGNYRIA